MNEQLKPCPFCESKLNEVDRNGFGYYFVNCLQCNARSGERLTEEAAIAAWNKRAKEAIYEENRNN